jgi:hypothetical protein
MELKGRPSLIVAVASGRPAKLNGVAGALRQIYPTLPVLVEHRDGSVVCMDPRIPSRFASFRAPIVVQSWPTELQDRDIGVDSEPVGREETERFANLRLDIMGSEHDCSNVNALFAVESGRLPRGAPADTPQAHLDPVRDMRDDVAVIAIEGMSGRRSVFQSDGTWIPIIVNGAAEATDPVVAARVKRRERERARDAGEPWTMADEAAIESGWHVREALGVDHDRSGRNWQSYLGQRTPREELIAAAIVRNWDGTLVSPHHSVGRSVDANPEGPDPVREL